MAADNETAPSGSGHCTTTSGTTSSNVLPPSSVPSKDVPGKDVPGKDVSNSLVYYKRGDKKNTARSVLKDITKYNDYRALNEIISELLDPRKDISSSDLHFLDQSSHCWWKITRGVFNHWYVFDTFTSGSVIF